MIGLLALAAAGAASCPEVVGADRLWAKPETQWVMIGEMHGTAEMPVFFGDLVCQAAASSQRPITVAMEQDAEMQPAIDAFLASNGGVAARSAFLKAPMWSGQDGRASQAMLALYDRLRLMKQAGQIRAVYAFIPRTSARTNGPHNAAMASMLKEIAAGRKDLVLAYMGNLHAAKSSVGQGADAFLPAAADLPPERTVSVDIESNGGEAWNCLGDSCAPHPMQTRDAKRGFASAGWLPWRFDWVFELGSKASASPPVNPAN
jgi:hypothetical protein